MILIDSADSRKFNNVCPGMPLTVSTTVFMVFLALIVVDISLFASILKQHYELSQQSDIRLNKVDFRSQYVGLDFLYTQTSTQPSRYEPITNDPILAVQINSSEPHAAARFDLHEWLSHVGTLSPKDRHFKISRNVSRSLIDRERSYMQ